MSAALPDPSQLAIALVVCALGCGILGVLAVLLVKAVKSRWTQHQNKHRDQNWTMLVVFGLTPLLLAHTALLGRNVWTALASRGDGAQSQKQGWECAVYFSLLLVTMIAGHSYWIAQMWFFSHNKVVAAGQGVLVVMYIPAGIASTVLTWNKTATTASDPSKNTVAVMGIFLVASTLLLFSNAVNVAANLPPKVHRLQPLLLRYLIIAVEMTLAPLFLSIATVALFFAFPNSLIYLTARMTWIAAYQLNLALCLLCKASDRFALFSTSDFRRTESFGNTSLEKGDADWSFKYNSMFRPKLFPTINVPSPMPQSANPPSSGYDDTASDAASIYSGTALMTGPRDDLPISNAFLAAPSAKQQPPSPQVLPDRTQQPFLQSVVPARPPRVQGDTLRSVLDLQPKR